MTTGPMSKEELRKLIADEAAPADAEAMIARGALARTERAKVYRIADISKVLPGELKKFTVLGDGLVEEKAVSKRAQKLARRMDDKPRDDS